MRRKAGRRQRSILVHHDQTPFVMSEQLVYALVFFVLLLFRARHDRFGVDGWRVKLQ